MTTGRTAGVECRYEEVAAAQTRRDVEHAATSNGAARGRRAAAFFDLDKTVIAESSTLAFGRPLTGTAAEPGGSVQDR